MELYIDNIKIDTAEQVKNALLNSRGDYVKIKYVTYSESEAKKMKSERNSPVNNYYEGDKYIRSEKEYTMYNGYRNNIECTDLLPDGNGRSFNLEKSQEYNYQQIIKTLIADGIFSK